MENAQEEVKQLVLSLSNIVTFDTFLNRTAFFASWQLPVDLILIANTSHKQCLKII